ncbi:DNA repair exonuclease SbcCD ATPase subunit [Geosmithia morbida]|uniref:DNA repair exonuclease SbcCD ATPase subunit n=1 Tax=Geosmithia morbida TaxID=1094350 RepID=A0A9P4YXI9_9HYPO|nr:DNA repair exonuclease SbcCD ATPase subunit [Geosmithia morbida]KAF4123624.1 DNA repair exonuclease SbcCD ATPase subunit [Geosmithia morbida]
MPTPGSDSPMEGRNDSRHHHSGSFDYGNRALVPMWDSSDPERAPPPLPLNPQSPSVSSRAGTSSVIQSAHAALNERVRESAGFGPPISKRLNDSSPDRSTVSRSSHRRTQTLQPGSVRDLSLMIEGASNNSPSPSPTRLPPHRHHSPSSTIGSSIAPRSVQDDKEWERDIHADTESQLSEKANSAAPPPGSSWTPILRPTARRAPAQGILGENTPPQSSTMLALHSMSSQSPRADSEPPLANVTNGSSASFLKQTPQPNDQLSQQLVTLTSIATSLQKEMSALSRRSRDNATDLLSLKEATNTRDEDIRKSLRDLLGSVNETSTRLGSKDYGERPFDSKTFGTTSPKNRAFQLPRIPSPKSFTESVDRGSVSTPSLIGGDGPSTVPMLERIIREMGTKEGQDALISRLTEVSRSLSGMATASKVDELLEHIQYLRTQSQTAMVPSSRELEHDGPLPASDDFDIFLKNERPPSTPSPSRGSGILNEDILSIIRSVKDSVAQGGGITAEVKALVRELRGEVLGMGREIGRRLEGVNLQSIEGSANNENPSKDEVSRIIDEGLEQMKEQLNHVLREHRRQSAQSADTSKTLVDYQEIYNAMRAALRDNESSRDKMPDLSRDDVVGAVRDAWETYKPEIEVQQLGLERDEILACLQEGLREYAHRDKHSEGATRDEVFQAVVEGLRHYSPPRMDISASISRDEIVEAVRDCLEEFEFPVAASAIGNDISRDDMVHAVREGLHDLHFSGSRALEHPGGGGGLSGDNEEIIGRLEDLKEYVKLEFRSVSQEAKDNVAANGRDTEQVLDATKDGFENLRIAIESYVDRATAEAGQEDFMQGLLRTMTDFKEEITELLSHSTDISREQLQGELEGLREVVNSSMVPASAVAPVQTDNKEIIEALHATANTLRQEILRPRAETAEIIDALNDGLNELRIGIDRMTNKPADLTANDEILDALQSGLDSVRADIESIRDDNNIRAIAAVPTESSTAPHIEILEALRSGLDSVRSDMHSIREESSDRTVAAVPLESAHNEILDALRSGLDSVRADIESIREQSNDRSVPTVPLESAHNEILDALRSGLDSVRADIESIREQSNARSSPAAAPESTGHDEILKVLRSGLDSVRSGIDSIRDQANERSFSAVPPESSGHDEILEALRSGLDSVRSDIESIREQNNDRALAPISAGASTPDIPSSDEQALILADMARHDDIKNLEVLITQLRMKLESMNSEPEPAPKDENSSNLESMLENIQHGVDDLSSREPSSAPPSQDLTRLESMIENIQRRVEELSSREPPAAAVTRDAESSKDRSASDDVASKEDVQAIEMILHNTKARLDDLMDGDQALRKDHLDAVEALILETRESMSSIAERMEAVSRKDDLSTMETLLNEIKGNFDEMKNQIATRDEPDEDKVSKADVAAVETAVLEIKTLLAAFQGVDLSDLPKKGDLSGIETLVKETKEKIESQNEASSMAIEKKDDELKSVDERVSEVKTFLQEFQETLKGKLEDGSNGIESLGKLLETMGEKIDKNDNVGADLKEMFETMKTQFEESKGIVTGAKLESDEKLQQATESIGTKIDDKITELMTKYTEFQEAFDVRIQAGEARDAETEAAVVGTKAVAEELKILTDTLGSTVTDSLEKMEEASKTVFTKVEELVSRSDEAQADGKAEHEQTRDRLDAAVTMVESLRGEVSDTNPKILEAIQEVLALVGQHYEHSKTATTDLQDKIIETRPLDQSMLLPPPEKYDDTEVRQKLDQLTELRYDDTEVRQKLEQLNDLRYDDTEVRQKLDQLAELRYDDSQVHEKLDRLAELRYDDTQVHEKLDQLAELRYDDSQVHEKLDRLAELRYDDTQVHEKLDQLVELRYDDTEVRQKLDQLSEIKYDDSVVNEKLDKITAQTTSTEQALSQLEKLDQVHESVIKTAAEVSTFLNTQMQRAADDYEAKEKKLREMDLEMERKRCEKEHLEASILSLKDEEERVRNSVTGLRTEQESLIRQKTRLTGDVSALDTAMKLRREDLAEMECRADRLERRILEGVMDHSRVLLMAKSNRSGGGAGDSMARRRVKRSSAQGEDGTATPRAATKPAVSMALSGKRSLASPGQAGAERRIASLGQINNNAPTGGVKRSQSVRTPMGGKSLRKRSWGGDASHGETNKENLGVGETVEEVDENESPALVGNGPEGAGNQASETTDNTNDDDEAGSDSGTLRRNSHGSSEQGYSEYSETVSSEWTGSSVVSGTDDGASTVGGDEGGQDLVVYGQ